MGIAYPNKSCICLQVVAGISAVPTADAVVTDEVNCYNCVVRLRSLPNSKAIIDKGIVAYHKGHIACEDGWIYPTPAVQRLEE